MRPATPERPARWSLLAGVAAVALYLATAGISFWWGLLPAAPVLDGLGPPAPYQWVKPPPDRVKDNKAPSGVTGSIPLTSLGSAGSVTTPDGQGQLLLDSNSVPVPPGQTSVSVTIQPLDPATVGPPPAGLHYDSNAYAIAGTYQPSNQPLQAMTATIVLSYATNAQNIYRWSGTGWDQLPSTVAGQNQLFAPVTKLGIFTTAGSGTGKTVAQPAPIRAVVLVVGIFAAVGLVLLVVVARRKPETKAGTPRGGPPRR